jgi:hypothetical protein
MLGKGLDDGEGVGVVSALHKVVVISSENFASISVSCRLRRGTVIYSTYIRLVTHSASARQLHTFLGLLSKNQVS